MNTHMKFLVRASFLQIYNEVISDLLKPERTNLMIREDKRKGVFVEVRTFLVVIVALLANQPHSFCACLSWRTVGSFRVGGSIASGNLRTDATRRRCARHGQHKDERDK